MSLHLVQAYRAEIDRLRRRGLTDEQNLRPVFRAGVLDQHKEKRPKDATIRERFDTYGFENHKERGRLDRPGDPGERGDDAGGGRDRGGAAVSTDSNGKDLAVANRTLAAMLSPTLDLVPALEASGAVAGRWIFETKSGPVFEYNQLAESVFRAALALASDDQNVDWSGWWVARGEALCRALPDGIAAFDLSDVRFFVTRLTRIERFSEGHLDAAIRNGTLALVLRHSRDLLIPRSNGSGGDGHPEDG